MGIDTFGWYNYSGSLFILKAKEEFPNFMCQNKTDIHRNSSLVLWFIKSTNYDIKKQNIVFFFFCSFLIIDPIRGFLTNGTTKLATSAVFSGHPVYCYPFFFLFCYRASCHLSSIVAHFAFCFFHTLPNLYFKLLQI